MHKAENSTLTTGPGCSVLFQFGEREAGVRAAAEAALPGQQGRAPVAERRPGPCGCGRGRPGVCARRSRWPGWGRDMADPGCCYGAWGGGGRAPAAPGPAGRGSPSAEARPRRRPRWARAGRAPGHGGLAGKGRPRHRGGECGMPAPFRGLGCRQAPWPHVSLHVAGFPVIPCPPPPALKHGRLFCAGTESQFNTPAVPPRL